MDTKMLNKEAVEVFGLTLAFISSEGYASTTERFTYTTKTGYKGEGRNITQLLQYKDHLVELNGITI